MDDGFHNHRQAVKRWRKRNPEKVRASHRRWRERNPHKWKAAQRKAYINWVDRNPEKQVFRSAKNNAKEKDIEFSISIEDINIPEACPLLNILMFFDPYQGVNPNTPTLDRIDNTKGYVAGNVWVISKMANFMKRDASIEELKTFANNISEIFN